MVVHLAYVENEVSSRKVLLIVGISILHIVVGGFDQFVTNVLHGEGEMHQVIRDISFMVPDLMHCFLPLFLLKERKDVFFDLNQPIKVNRKFRRDFIAMLGIVSILIIICRITL